MNRHLLLIFLIAFLSHLAVTAGERQDSSDSTYRVSIVTCYPGPIVYELYGHTAIRITHGGTDNAYNFGMFSFSKPNFIYRFVKGETDYALGCYPFAYFMPEYVRRDSKIVEQVLNLDQKQAAELYRRLEFLARPENREYRYNYVYDNCATRPRDMIESVTGGLNYPQPADPTLSFRDIMRGYAANYPWYQFGIDLVLGPGIDFDLSTRQQMFAPIYLMQTLAATTYTDSNGHTVPVVAETNVLFDGSESPILPPTPWYLTPMYTAVIMLLITVVVTCIDIRRLRTSRWLDTLWFLLTGLAGCLIFFLIFVSEHEATSPNYLAFWLNPFCLAGAILPWIKSARKILYLYHFINFATVLLLMLAWGFLPQQANAAFFPLMACTLLRSANYVVIYRKCARKSK